MVVRVHDDECIISIPKTIYAQAVEAARREGVPITQWVRDQLKKASNPFREDEETDTENNERTEMTQILTPPGEAAFAFVFRPQAPMQEGKDPQYQLTLVWDENDKKLDKLRKAIVDVATAKFGAKAKQMLEKGQLKNPLRPGSDRGADWMEGKVFLTARSTDKPDVVDRDMNDLISSTDFYPGCVARMDIYLFAFDKAGNKGVSAILNNVQKTDEGERKGGRRSAGEAFKDDDDDGSDLT